MVKRKNKNKSKTRINQGKIECPEKAIKMFKKNCNFYDCRLLLF